MRPKAPAGDGIDPIRLELFTNRFTAIAREMGEVLRRTSLSTNVKERLDFSCAVLNPRGELVVNAPHIPVHLGALGICVRRLRDALAMEVGDVVVSNHPAFGGSHLPDVTVVTPVYDGGELLGYVASRAHHAEIGGTSPGSMPPGATKLIEEGVVIAPRHLARGGVFDWDGMVRTLREAPHPTRALEENIADLRAAIAANHRGAQALVALARGEGSGTVLRFMEALQDLAERRMRACLLEMPEGTSAAEERLDDDSVLCAAISIRAGQATISFEGTSGVHPGNLNATPGIVHSAVFYVMRLLIRDNLPLNEGLMRAVTIRIPEGCLLSPSFDGPDAPAVVGGNVETSQRLVDTLLKALGIVACSQGTMNNVLFGNGRFGYYETIGGGAGAGAGFDGESGVHTHMTNTRITDPEVLEHRYPVRLERFALRRGSGGSGRWCGGDGLVREWRFLEPLRLSVLTQHRVSGPYGSAGGGAGAPGQQAVISRDGAVKELQPIDGCEVGPGDRLVLESPGGGGWGPPEGDGAVE